MKKKFLFILFILFSLSSCSSVLNDDCPYLIANKNCEITNSNIDDENEEINGFAKLKFAFFNGADKTVKSFTLSFMLYDSDGNNPFIGTNNISETFNLEVNPKESKEISFSLDKYLSIVPSEPYQIDFMYVKKIFYTDGTEWSDPFGMYSSREVME